jgi:hypothetical protein
MGWTARRLGDPARKTLAAVELGRRAFVTAARER